MTIEKYPFIVCCTEKDSNVIFAEFPNNLKVDLAVAREIVDNRMDFARNKKHYVVLDISNVKEISTEAKEFLQRPDAGLKNILGAAFIASNPVSTLIANIFIKTPKDFPAKFFANKEDAFEWIIEYRQKNQNSAADKAR